MGAYINQQENNIFCLKYHFLAIFGLKMVKNGHFQDKKPINPLVIEQFYRISALKITGYFSSMGLHVGIQKQMIFGSKMPFFGHFQSKKAHFWGFWGLVLGLRCQFCRKKIIFHLFTYIKRHLND